jgi:uncharacterized protein (UPF0548 family)
VLFIRKPSPEVMRAFLLEQASHNFTYAAVGGTLTDPPARYALDHTRVKLGVGGKVFAIAKSALQGWHQFQLGWLEAWPPDTTIVKGQAIAILARSIGLWWLNACRIVAVIDDDGPIRRFGFAYGTLPKHAGSGEERFLIEWDTSNGDVWYDILAFSRPRHFLVKLGYPIVRLTQKRFGRQSAIAMRNFVAERFGKTDFADK